MKLYNGDSKSILGLIGNDTVDLVVTSPPYYNAMKYSQWGNYELYVEDMKTIFKEVVRVVKNQKYIIINVSDILSGEKRINRKPIMADFVKFMIEFGCEYEDDIIWDKGEVQSKRGVCAEPHPYYFKPINCFEHILIFRKNFINKEKIPCPICHETITQSNGLTGDGVQSWECKNPTCIRTPHNRGKRFSERTILMDSARKDIISEETLKTFRRDIVSFPPVIKINSKGENILGHPAPYPLEIPNFAIECYSKSGDVVLDCFMGSGTTGIVCKNLRRDFIGIEINKDYFEIAKERINNDTLQ